VRTGKLSFGWSLLLPVAGEELSSMHDEPTVFVVDDHEQARKSVCALVHSMGIRAASFASAEEFLATYEAGDPGCLVTDVRMLGMSGLELQEELNRREILLPVIVLTAHARTLLTVRAMQAGAITLLEKPYEDDDLWDAIRKGLATDVATRAEHQRRRSLRSRIAGLAPSQRRVLDMIVAGTPNKAIAEALDISIRTVENRRREVFERMGADSLAELVRMVVDAGMAKDLDH
jgi:FixJ family two-component response regulator